MKCLMLSLVLLFVVSCGNDIQNPYVTSDYNGNYVAYAYTLEGDCGDLGQIEFTIWDKHLYDDPNDQSLNLNGELIGRSFTGLVETDVLNVSIEFMGSIDEQIIEGNWWTIDGTCNGYFEGYYDGGVSEN